MKIRLGFVLGFLFGAVTVQVSEVSWVILCIQYIRMFQYIYMGYSQIFGVFSIIKIIPKHLINTELEISFILHNPT